MRKGKRSDTSRGRMQFGKRATRKPAATIAPTYCAVGTAHPTSSATQSTGYRRSGLSTMVPSGGSLTSTFAGRPCQPGLSAITPGKLPTLLPP